MRTTLLLLALLSGCASDPWTRQDTAYQAAYTLALAGDAYTTTRIQYMPGVAERQPLARSVLGDQPSTADTWQYFATMSIAHYLIARSLPERWRRYWQVGGITLHGVAVARNCDIGLCDDPPDIPSKYRDIEPVK